MSPRTPQAGGASHAAPPPVEGVTTPPDLIAHDVIVASTVDGSDRAPDQLAQITPPDLPADAADPLAAPPVLVAALPNEVSHAPTLPGTDGTAMSLASGGASDHAIGHISVSAFAGGASWSGGFAGLPAPSMDHMQFTSFAASPPATSFQPSSVHYADHNLVPVNAAPHVETHAAAPIVAAAHSEPPPAAGHGSVAGHGAG